MFKVEEQLFFCLLAMGDEIIDEMQFDELRDTRVSLKSV